MTIQEALEKFEQNFDKEIFVARQDGTKIIVNVAFIYRVKEIEALAGTYEGFPIVIGRRSCW